MVPNGVAASIELVWHFSGYLRLTPDGMTTLPKNFDGAPGAPNKDDGLNLVSSQAALPPPPQLGSAPSPLVTLPGPEQVVWHATHVLTPMGGSKPFLPHLTHFPHTALPLLPLGGSGGGGGDDFAILVTYQPGGDQAIFDLRQINLVQSNDTLADGPGAPFLHPLDVSAYLDSMLVKADATVPQDLQAGQPGSASLITFVTEHDAHLDPSHPADAAYLVGSGAYLNGVLQAPGVDIHQTAIDALSGVSTSLSDQLAGPPALPAGHNAGVHIQDLSVGSNYAVNDAGMAGLSSTCGSMLVLGNCYQTELISQTNVFSMNDRFVTSGGNGSGSNAVSFDPNVTQNAAEFINTGAVQGDWTAGGPLQWSVDVLHGSFYDVKTMTQLNYISDNDTVSQTQSVGYSQIIAGDNGQVNAADFQNLSAQYDLIIVEGNYYRADLVYQTNVVLDANKAWQIGGSGAADGHSISAGGDTLLNDATIVYVGAQGSQAATGGMIDLAHALDGGSGALDSSLIDRSFPNLTGTIHVLLVTGNYYDLNSLQQTNVISDANVALQAMTAQGGQQSLSTGHDQAINVGAIVDGGSLTTPYVHGSYYSDTILIQTNLITTDHKTVIADPNQLAPEVVAFTGADAHGIGSEPQHIYSPTDTQHHADILGGILH